MSKSPKPPPEPPLPDDVMSSGLEPDWIDPLVGSEGAYDRQLFAELVDEMVPKLKRSLVRSVLPPAKALAQISDDSGPDATRFERLTGLVAGRDELQNMEGLGDLSSDPDAAPGFPVSLGLSEALEVAGLSEQGDAKPFEKAFGEWCRQWHVYDGWQHVAALQTLVSMTQGWGAKDGDHKYESLTTLDPWIPPTEGLTVVHRQLKLPPFGWIPTEQAWPAFESEVLARVKAELAQFKEEAEAHFKASRLERKKSKRTDPRMRELLLFQMEGKPEEVAEAHFGGKDELKRIESKTTHLPMRILIRFQIEGKKRREIIDEFWEDELGRLGEEGRYVRLESLERKVRRYVHDTAKRIGIQVRTKQRTPPSSHATEGS